MLKADWIDGDVVDGAAMSAIGAAVNAIRSYHVDAYGADPTGATFSDTAIADAVTAMGSDPGVLQFGSGTYKCADSVGTFGPGQSVIGQGKGATTILFSGTGDCIRAYDPRAWTTFADMLAGTSGPGLGGQFTGFKIDGTGSGTNSSGLHIGDFHDAVVDIHVLNFAGTGGKGVWFDNRVTWTERSQIWVHAENCTQCVVFDAGNGGYTSFDYATYWIGLGLNPNQDGVVLTGNVEMAGCALDIRGTADPHAATNSGTVVKVGTSGSDASFLYNCTLGVSVEIGLDDDSASVKGHTSLNISAVGSIWRCQGLLAFPARGVGKVQFQNAVAGARLAEFQGILDVGGDVGRTMAIPRTDFIADPAGANVLGLIGVADAVNHVGVKNSATGTNPCFYADGTDSNISLEFFPKGGGWVAFYDGNGAAVFLTNPGATDACNYLYLQNTATGGSPSLGVWGSDSAVGLDLTTRGAGVVTANNNPVSTRVAVPSTASSAGTAGMWATDGSYLYVCTATNTWVRAAATFATW